MHRLNPQNRYLTAHLYLMVVSMHIYLDTIIRYHLVSRLRREGKRRVTPDRQQYWATTVLKPLICTLNNLLYPTTVVGSVVKHQAGRRPGASILKGPPRDRLTANNQHYKIALLPLTLISTLNLTIACVTINESIEDYYT